MNLLDELVEAADVAALEHSVAIRAAALKLAEYERLHKELALKLGNDAPHPSLCELVAQAGRPPRWPIDDDARGVGGKDQLAFLHRSGRWTVLPGIWLYREHNLKALKEEGYTHWVKL